MTVAHEYGDITCDLYHTKDVYKLSVIKNLRTRPETPIGLYTEPSNRDIHVHTIYRVEM